MARRSVFVVGEPQERRRKPRNVVDCQFSTHLCMAIALKHRRMGWDDYEPALADPEIFKLMERIEVFEDAECEANFPIAFSAVVEIKLNSGETLRYFQYAPRGEPDDMPTQEAVQQKFMSLADPILGTPTTQALYQKLMLLDTNQPVSKLFEHCTHIA